MPNRSKVPYSTCRSCDQRLMWVRTARGKSMPIDYDWQLSYLWNEGEEVDYDPDSMTCHFETCPKADKHRKGKR